MSENDAKKKPTPEEIEAWVNGVHEGPCCADQEECDDKD